MSHAEIEKKIITILQKHNAGKIGVFGSFARGEERPESDIDLVVTFKDRKSLLALIRIERELSETLGRKVDLLTEESIHPYLADTIKSELKVLHQ